MILSGSRILALGDSITYDTSNPITGAYRQFLGPSFATWFRSSPRWVGENPAKGSDDITGIRMCGASGQRVDQINATYEPGGQASRQNPDLVIIHIGTNDMTQLNSGTWVGGSIELSITNLQTLLTSLFANGHSNMLVCVCKIIPNQVAGADTNITNWNSQMATMVAAHPNADRIFIADCNAAFKANANWAVDYMADNTHPNNAGEAVIASTILSAIQSNVTLSTRPPSYRRRAIKPHAYSLSYTASTATILGTGNTLDTTQPWAVSFDIDLSRSSLAVANGVLTLRTDQPTAFGFTFIGTNQRYIEFGSSANFNRFFPLSTASPNTRERASRGHHQIVVTFDGVSRTAVSSYKLVIDGEYIPLTSGAGLAAAPVQNAIGAAFNNTGTFDMADLTIWNGGSAMTPAQVRDWYFNNTLPTGPTLIRRYQHTNGSGTTLTDSTGNQNGTIGTATWTSNVPTLTRSAASTRTAASTRSVAS